MLAQEEPKTTTKPPATGAGHARAGGPGTTAGSAAPGAFAAPVAASAATAPDPAGGRGDALAGMLARCVQCRGASPLASDAEAEAGRSSDEIPDDPPVATESSTEEEQEESGGRVAGGAVLQRVGGAGAAQHPPSNHTFVSVDGPAATQCGGFQWSVNFVLDRPSIAGGYFVQELTLTRSATDGDNAALPALDLAQHYWEAWRVDPGDTEDALVANGTFSYADRYFLAGGGLNTKGSAHYRGNVAFYEGLTLPDSFIANNPATMAHDLPSTTVDPKLKGGTVNHRHNISATWNCCGSNGAAATAHDTVLSARHPA